VVTFLSREWVEALDGAAAAASARPDDAPWPSIVIQHEVDGARYHVVVEPGRVRFRVGAAAAPTVTLTADRATATAIARGTLSAQRAFMAGRLRVRGDATALTGALPAFAALPDLFAAVRDQTEFDGSE
jgi:putative sterol carrier protein